MEMEGKRKTIVKKNTRLISDVLGQKGLYHEQSLSVHGHSGFASEDILNSSSKFSQSFCIDQRLNYRSMIFDYIYCDVHAME
jgi:hypothetical protein